MIPHWFAPHGVSAYEDLARRIEVIYGTPANPGAAPLTAPPVVVATPPKSNIKVLEQLVGATVLRLENGDVVNMRVFVDEMGARLSRRPLMSLDQQGVSDEMPSMQGRYPDHE